jgi:hypothetical protein
MTYTVETTKTRTLPPQFVTRTVVEPDKCIAEGLTLSAASAVQRANPGTRIREVWSAGDYADAVAFEANRGA